MTFQEALKWLYATQQIGVKLGLENIQSLLSLLGAPEKRLRFLHVAGTNGKGSVCAFLDSILRAGEYTTGLFTSPHLVEFQERICIQGVPISAEEVTEGLNILRVLSEQMEGKPTFFELTVALALWHFSRCNVDVVIWETGLGGRWDATNVVVPLVSVITTISFDHQEWLGDTLIKIAFEKAGILKPHVPAVSSPQLEEVREELRRVARLQETSVTFVEKPCTSFKLGLLGPHQQWNAAVSIEAIQNSGLTVDSASLRRGLAEVQWPCRFQMLSSQLVVDGAHNPDAARALVATWREVFKDQKAHVIFGSLRDKASDEMLLILSEIAQEFLFVSLQNPRSRKAIEHKLPGRIPRRYFENGEAALTALSSQEDPILVTGSLFLAGEILSNLYGKTYQLSMQ